VAQAGSGALLAALLWGWIGPVEGYSALLGGLSCVVPNAFLALRLSMPMADAGAVLRAAWIGEIGKIALTVVMLIVVLTLVRPLAHLPLLAGFIVAQTMVIVGLLGNNETTTEDTDGG